MVSGVGNAQSWRKGGEPVWHTFSGVISALSTKHFEEDVLKKNIQWQNFRKSICFGKILIWVENSA